MPMNMQPQAGAQPGQPQGQPTQGQPPQAGAPQGGQPPNQQEMDALLASVPPEEKDKAERYALTARAALSGKSGDSLVDVASQGTEGVATVTHSILGAIQAKTEISEDDLPIAVMVIAMEVFAFLVATGKAKDSPEGLRTAVAASLAKLAGQIGAPDQEDIQGMNGMMKGLGDEVMSMLQGGQQQGGQPQEEQPPQGAAPARGGMIPGV